MKTIITEALESAWADGKDIEDASDIPVEFRPEIIRAWRETAGIGAIVEAFTNPVDEDAENMRDSIAMDTAWLAAGVPLYDHQWKTIGRYWWKQIAWYVDKAIEEVKEEHEMTRAIAREERAEQQSDWNRDRLASKGVAA